MTIIYIILILICIILILAIIFKYILNYYDNTTELDNNNKQEWNKEDKEMLETILECIRFADNHYKLLHEKINDVNVKAWLLNHINLN